MILLDADGVFADIHTPLCRIMGLDIRKWKPGEYWFEKAFGISTESVWEHPEIRGSEFWANAPRTPWADELMAAITKKYAVGAQCFLTKPVRDPASAMGKMQWFEKHYPKHKFLIGTSKKFNAGDHKVLIDDYEGNVDEFDDHGGRGILFPRIWNKLHEVQDPVEYVRVRL